MTTLYPGVVSPRNGGPVLYGESFEMALNDVVTFAFIACTFILFFAFLFPYVSYWRFQKKAEAIKYLAVFVSIYIWCIIMICYFGQEWQSGTVTTTTQYVTGSNIQIQAKIGLHMGLRGFNVTLLGLPINQANQTINYNEIYSWEWQQGIVGYGPYSGRIQQEYRRSIERGDPVAVFWIAEYFILDGDGIYYGRWGRIAGWYTHILMWIALVCWALTNAVFVMNTKFGAIGLIFTGSVMLLANIVYAGVWGYNLNPLVIPFPDGNISLSYGWSFYLNLFTGLFVCILSGVLILLYDLFPKKINFFFNEHMSSIITKPPKSGNDSDVEGENQKEMEEVEESEGEEERSTPEKSSSESLGGETKTPNPDGRKKVTISAEHH